jgi:hypothetical protein
MTATTVGQAATRPAPPSPTLDDQIRGIIPQLLPWLAAQIFDHYAHKAFSLNGSWTDAEIEPRNQPAIQELVAFLEQTIGGKATWKASPSYDTPSCEIARPFNPHRLAREPQWNLTFRALTAHHQRLRHEHPDEDSFQPRIDINYCH